VVEHRGRCVARRPAGAPAEGRQPPARRRVRDDLTRSGEARPCDDRERASEVRSAWWRDRA
jgi:hypothetical protein